MKYKGKNKYTARFLGCLLFTLVIPFVLFYALFDALKIAVIHFYTEIVEFTKGSLIDGWKSWD